MMLGVRTIDGTAREGKDYVAVDQTVATGGYNEQVIQMSLIRQTMKSRKLREGRGFSDEGEDLDFFLDLYDGETGSRLLGRDTRTRVSIIRDSCQASTQYIGFSQSLMKVQEGMTRFHQGQIYVEVERYSGDTKTAQAVCYRTDSDTNNTLFTHLER